MILAQIVVENLSRLLVDNQQAERAVTPGAGGKVDQETELIAAEVRDAAAGRAPYLWGVLSGAHRSQVFGSGRFAVFIDPAVVHPVGGGRPAVYGPILHETRPWMAWTMQQDAPAIAERHGREIVSELEGIYG